MKKILSIDGGGIRGIIPAIVLKKIEEETNQATAKTFDLIAGTSTGGLLALGLSKDGGDGKKERYTAKDLVDIYKNRGSDIFGSSSRRETSIVEPVLSSAETLLSSAKSFIQEVPALGDWVASIEDFVLNARGLSDEIYSHKGLVNVLKCYFGEATLENIYRDTEVMVTCYDIERRSPFFLKSWYPMHGSVKIWEAARATSAAPTFFEPVQLQIGNEERNLIDGGIFINSPAVSAYAEAKRIFPDEKDFFVLSLGTGTFTKRLEYEAAKDWGKFGWSFHLLDCIFDGVQDAADYQMNKFFDQTHNYFRLTGDLSGDNDRMDNVNKRNIKSLQDVAKGIIESDNFGRCLMRLKQLIASSDNPI